MQGKGSETIETTYNKNMEGSRVGNNLFPKR